MSHVWVIVTSWTVCYQSILNGVGSMRWCCRKRQVSGEECHSAITKIRNNDNISNSIIIINNNNNNNSDNKKNNDSHNNDNDKNKK